MYHVNTSTAADLPNSCKSAMEHMEKELKKEDTNFTFAELSPACIEKITACERELNKQGYWDIALVAYQNEHLR